MGHLGFSYIGLLWLAMLFVPNLYWVKRQPTGYTAAGENRLLVALERIGEAGVTCCALVFSDFNLHSLSPRSLWLALSLALMMAYEFWWVRYFRSGRTLRDFYRPLLGVPVAGATLPYWPSSPWASTARWSGWCWPPWSWGWGTSASTCNTAGRSRGESPSPTFQKAVSKKGRLFSVLPLGAHCR